MNLNKKIKQTFVRQHERSDCGVCCLSAILRYYGAYNSLSSLRELSGTTLSGTTILGLKECAISKGFTAACYRAEIDDLKIIHEPCILHVTVNENLKHYIVCYKWLENSQTFLIGDPAKGISEISEKELVDLWNSKALLKLCPGPTFFKTNKNTSDRLQLFASLIKNDVKRLIFIVALGLLVTILSMSTAVFSQKLIDNILPSKNRLNLVISINLLFILLFAKSFLDYFRQSALIRQNKDFSIRIISHFIKSLVYLPKSFFESRRTGDLISRMNDAISIQRNMSYIVGNSINDVILAIVSYIFIFQYSPLMALCVLVFIPIIVLITLKFTKPLKLQQRAIMLAGSTNESKYIDVIQGISVIKDTRTEVAFHKKIENSFDDLQSKNVLLGNTGNKYKLTSEAASIFFTITLIIGSSFLVLSGHLKVGEMIAIIALTNILLSSVSKISQLNILINEGAIAFDRLYEITSLPGEDSSDNDESNINFSFQKFEFKNVSFGFPGRAPILKSISFELKKNETIIFTGECGSGKTTCFNIIQKHYHPKSGEIFLNDQPFSMPISKWRQITGCVSQEAKIFNGSLLENIDLSMICDVQKVIDFCTETGFNKYFDPLPQAYFTNIGEDGVTLSGGQKQLVCLARALYRKPQILLLDEITASMDKETEDFVLNLLVNLKSQMSIILITHKTSLNHLAERIYQIKNTNMRLI